MFRRGISLLCDSENCNLSGCVDASLIRPFNENSLRHELSINGGVLSTTSFDRN